MEDRRALVESLLVATVLSFYVFWLSEWIFLATGISFLSGLAFFPSLVVLLSSSLLVVAPLAIVALGCIPLWFLSGRAREGLATLLLCLPAALLTWTAFLLIDNFTYTMAGVGLVATKEPWLWIYRIGLLAGFVRVLFACRGWLVSLAGSASRGRWVGLSGALLLLSGLCFAGQLASSSDAPEFERAQRDGKPPNILFLASDGIPAEEVGVYDERRDATPFLDEFASEALVFGNAFANASATFPSTISMLSGRSPFTQKTFFRHRPLRDGDSERHLPAILNGLGYEGEQIADRIFSNTVVQNMRHGFSKTFFVDIAWLPAGLYHDVMFDLLIVERALQRVRRLAGGVVSLAVRMLRGPAKPAQKKDVAPASVADGEAPADAKPKPPRKKPSALGDGARVDAIVDAVETLPEPFYLHVHLFDTHGSAHASMESFRETIETADGYFARVIGALKEAGRLDDTIVIISSDHSRARRTHDRVPLLIRFPRGEHAGFVDRNVQLMDVAPTLLEYMGQPVPAWMEGQSLLDLEDVPEERGVYTFYDRPVRSDVFQGEMLVDDDFDPALGSATLITCGEWFHYSIRDERLVARGQVDTPTESCEAAPRRPAEDVEAQIEAFLEERGVTPNDMPPRGTKLL